MQGLTDKRWIGVGRQRGGKDSLYWGISDPPPGVRPSLEYQYAFDLCAVEVHRIGGPVVVFASNPFYARELLKRLDGCRAKLFPVGEWISSTTSIHAVLGPEVIWEHSGEENVEEQQAVPAVVWAGPDRERGEQVLSRVLQILSPAGHLYVIVSGWLARFLPEWRENGALSGCSPVGLRQIKKWLRKRGFAIEALYGFHGPTSILWGYAFRLLERLGQGDLADRSLFRMRASYAVSGWQALCAPVSVISARRK